MSCSGYPNPDHRPPFRVPALLGVLALTVSPPAPAQAQFQAQFQVHHDLQVQVDPLRGRLDAEDTLTLPAGTTTLEFTLHAGLEPKTETPGASLKRTGTTTAAVPLERFRAQVPAQSPRLTIRYGGLLRHPVTDIATDGGRPMPSTPGLIDPGAVYLDGASGWYPDPGGPLTFSLTVSLPPGWRSVSQGVEDGAGTSAGTEGTRWTERQPQDEIYLVAAPFTVYRKATPHGEAQVYLRAPDPDLAQRYLEATIRYLDLYSQLLGPYPYGKFALLENAWETGYGMPSFTLIGSRVLRLPFLLESSYPHEILHNWWGNGVWIDYRAGNWAEGLTSYLADHLVQERQGRGAAHRRATLQKYADYVDEAQDFPLTSFRGRHGEVTQAVGYNKSLMVFHTLRQEVGEQAFVEGLRRLYREHLFRTAGWADVQRAFEAEAGRDLGWFFAQWVEREGAPRIGLSGVTVTAVADGYVVSGRIEQTGTGEPYRLLVPVAVQGEGDLPAVVKTVALDGRSAPFEVHTSTRPVRLQVDPQFDLFRRLDPAELPASLGRLFGARQPLLVLPGSAPATLLRAYRLLAAEWTRGGGETVLDSDVQSISADRPVWVLGWENRFIADVAYALVRQGDHLEQPHPGGRDGSSGLSGGRITLADRTLPRTGHAFTLALPRRGGPSAVLGWVGAEDEAAVAGITRKLRHYGRQGYVVFNTPSLQAVLQGEWAALDSPLGVVLDPAGADTPLRLPPTPPLNPSGVGAGVKHTEEPRRATGRRWGNHALEPPLLNQALDDGLELRRLAEAPPQPLLTLPQGEGLQTVGPDPTQDQGRIADGPRTFFACIHRRYLLYPHAE